MEIVTSCRLHEAHLGSDEVLWEISFLGETILMDRDERYLQFVTFFEALGPGPLLWTAIGGR